MNVSILMLLIVAGVLLLAGFVVGLAFFLVLRQVTVRGHGWAGGNWRKYTPLANAHRASRKAGNHLGRSRDLQAVRHVGGGGRGPVRGDLAEDRPDPVDRIQFGCSGHLYWQIVNWWGTRLRCLLGNALYSAMPDSFCLPQQTPPSTWRLWSGQSLPNVEWLQCAKEAVARACAAEVSNARTVR
jgi:hypothetical protein